LPNLLPFIAAGQVQLTSSTFAGLAGCTKGLIYYILRGRQHRLPVLCSLSFSHQRGRMNSTTMASTSACLRGLQRLQLGAWPLRQGLAGRCLRSLHGAFGDRSAPRRQLSCTQAALSQQGPSPFSRTDAPAHSRLLPLLARPLGMAPRISGQRQLHASTVCAAKKKSAENLVKRISRGGP